MDIETFRNYCLSKKYVTEETPFDQVTLCFKVANKIFAITNIDTFESINLKCEPEKAVELRETHSGILPGYHMNKKHWNTVLTDGSVSDKLIIELINESYNLVYNALPNKIKIGLNIGA